MKLEEALGAIYSCSSIRDLEQALQSICQNYGFASFNFLDTGSPHKREPFYVGSIQPQFSADYFGEDLMRADPCIAHARRTNTAFTWSEVPFPQYRGVRKSGAQRTLEVAADHGYREGLIVPFHFADQLGRVHSSLVAFFWSDQVLDFQKRASESRHELHFLMLYWAQKCVELLDDKFEPQQPFARHCLERRLTDRERDVLAWAARGKTAQDTAAILHLSEQTVNTHIRNALTKLEANNKTHGVVKAIQSGLIDV